MKERGIDVQNLGICVPEEELISVIKLGSPDLVVLSSLSGHLFQECKNLITCAKSHKLLETTQFVVGGNPTTSKASADFISKKLVSLGFTRTFFGDQSEKKFESYLKGIGLFSTGSAPLAHAI